MQDGGFKNRGMRTIRHIGDGLWIDIGIDCGNGIFQRCAIKQRAFGAEHKADHVRFSGGGKGGCQTGGFTEGR